jgi:hypothetical protein
MVRERREEQRERMEERGRERERDCNDVLGLLLCTYFVP